MSCFDEGTSNGRAHDNCKSHGRIEAERANGNQAVRGHNRYNGLIVGVRRCVGISSGYKVSGTTAEALAYLTMGGSEVTKPSSAEMSASDGNMTISADNGTPHVEAADGDWTIGDSNELEKRINAMSSKQLSDAMYGDGIERFGGMGRDNLQGLLDDERQNAQWQLGQVDNVELSAETRAEYLDQGTAGLARNNEMQAAFDNRTLIVQTGSDVKGLDDDLAEVFNLTNTEITGNYDGEFFENSNNNGKSDLVFWAGASMYLTW